MFISLFLVAVILTGAVLKTLTGAQKSVVETGSSTEQNMSIPPYIESVILTCDISNGTLLKVDLTTRIPPGGEALGYKDIMVSWHSGDHYISGINYDNGVHPDLSGVHGFRVRELKGNSDHVLNVGEIIEIMVNIGNYSVKGGDELRAVLVTPSGQSEYKVVVPPTVNRKKYVF